MVVKRRGQTRPCTEAFAGQICAVRSYEMDCLNTEFSLAGTGLAERV